LGDTEGFKKYHLEPYDYEGAVQKEVKMIQDVEAIMPMKYFEVRYMGEQIGYMVGTGEILYSFCISKKYRTRKGVLTEWWSKVKHIMDEVFICALHRNNTRGIKFLQRMGMREVELISDKSLITFSSI